MATARDDFLLRQLGLVAEALRRLRARLGGGASAEEVMPAIRAAEGELLGTRTPLLRSLDAATAASLLGSTEAVGLWVELLRLEAQAHRAAGDERAAQAVEHRAMRLEQVLAAEHRSGPPSPGAPRDGQ